MSGRHAWIDAGAGIAGVALASAGLMLSPFRRAGDADGILCAFPRLRKDRHAERGNAGLIHLVVEHIPFPADRGDAPLQLGDVLGLPGVVIGHYLDWNLYRVVYMVDVAGQRPRAVEEWRLSPRREGEER